MTAATPGLEVEGLRKAFASRGGPEPTVVLDGVDLTVRAGEIVALVGASGSGKSTIGKILAGLETKDAGTIRRSGVDFDPARRSSRLGPRPIQMIFQDPFASLNPVHPVRHHLERPLRLCWPRASADDLDARARALLASVGLGPADELLQKHPHALSGGQRQRVAIARSLAVEPEILVADEPTSMLDVSLRMGVLNLLAKERRARGLAILFITHDLASARYLADRVLVIHAGRIVEEGPADAILRAPQHPYTRLLLAAVS